MGLVDGLISDKSFVMQALLSLIDEERHRIVSAGLMDHAKCDQILGLFMQKTAANPALTKDDVITKLTALHESMKNMTLAGDKFYEEPVPEFDKAEVMAQLDELVFKFGSCGKHQIAYQLEQIIKSIQGE